MSDGEKEPTRSLFGEWTDKYGPYGFGVGSLLAIWFTVVKPEMDRNALKFDELRAVVQQQRVITEQLHDVIRDQQDVGKILVRAAELLKNGKRNSEE